MAAAMRHICGCVSSHFNNVVNLAIVNLHIRKNARKALPLVACCNCEGFRVMLAEGKTLSSICHWGTSLHVSGGGRVCGKTSRAIDRNIWPTLNASLSRYLFPHKHKTLSGGALFHCRTWSSQKTMLQTESTNRQRGDAKLRAETETSGRLNLNNGQPEKKENIKTIPNLLTAARMASAPLLGYMVVCESFIWALSIFVFAGVTDLLDGYIARNFVNQTSALGSALDPLADKLLVTVLTISLTSVGLIPLPLTGLIVLRDVSLISGGFYIRYRSLHPPITLSRYFDLSHATVSVTPTLMSKLNTGLQLSLVACSLAAPVFGFVDHVCLQALWWATGATTFITGMDYMWSWKKYIKLLEKDQREL